MCGCERKPKRAKFDWVERTGVGTETNVKELEPRLNGKYFYTNDTVYNFGFSGGGISFGFKGSSLEVDFLGCKSYIAAYIDDMEEIVIIANDPGYIKVVDGLDPDKIHSVTLTRRNEGNGGEGSTKIAGIRISDGGKYYVKDYKNGRKRIEVLGDSICCGYGNLYDPAHPVDNSLDMEDGSKTFATMLADYYDADLTTCCISGIGVGNAANSPWPLLPVYKSEGGQPHDFTKNIPDVVIIELGTNDHACGNTGDEFVENATNYIEFIRGNYPDVPIIWYYGVMGDTLKPQIESVVKKFNDAGDDKVFCLFTVQDAKEAPGGAGHPSLETHERMAKELEKFINKNVKW